MSRIGMGDYAETRRGRSLLDNTAGLTGEVGHGHRVVRYPIALDAGHAIGQDVVVVSREVELPEGAGRMTFDFRVTGVLGFLVAKVGALTGRDKPKDAYDIVWIIENWAGGPAGAAAAITTSAAFARPEVPLVLDRLVKEFAAPDRLGPRSYVRFMAFDGMTGDDRTRLARQSVGAVAELRQAL